jgi:hypothetical protein
LCVAPLTLPLLKVINLLTDLKEKRDGVEAAPFHDASEGAHDVDQLYDFFEL